MDKTTLDYIRSRDYFKGEDNFARIRGREAILCWGQHKESPPLVTVVIPSYRRVELLKQALDRALMQQGFDDYQILIVDDDAEGEVTPVELLVREYDDARIIYYRNRENLGLMDNWNMCYWLARSEWVCTLHDDDMFTANFLQKMAGAVRKYPQIDALFNLANQFDGAAFSDEDVRRITGPVAEQATKLRSQRVWRQNFRFAAGRTTGSFIRRNAFVACGGFGRDRQPGTEDILYNDDYVLAVRLFANFNCYILPQRIYNYRIGANNGSARVKDYLPDVVQEYYLGRQISARKCVLWRWAFYKKNKYRAIEMANQLNALVASGNCRMNREASVDLDRLREAFCLDERVSPERFLAELQG
ncbi:MAG: glycosyltransferase family 2 protein [Oscillospiraceae bacterium]|nr:glycosyltransferase family 2 protein [Oscillospiraceae bacterium]